MASEFQVTGKNAAALFTLKMHRGDGMTLLAMNWKSGQPPIDFVGFAIEYKEPGGIKSFSLKNRLCFPGPAGEVNPNTLFDHYHFRLSQQKAGPARTKLKLAKPPRKPGEKPWWNARKVRDRELFA